MIVAISHPGDDHAAPVLDALRRLGAEAALLDLADFPARATLALEYGARGAGDWTFEGPAGPIRAADVTAVWWRRPRDLSAPEGLAEEAEDFAMRQASEALCGLAASVRARWVNHPWRDGAAAHKPHQLAAAERAGLAVPWTLVTNDPERADGFLRRLGPGPAIHKPLHVTHEDWRPTRILGPDERARLADLCVGPVILQEYVPGVDVRVTAVGDRLFAADIDARGTSSPEDFRPVFAEARVAPCELPAAVAARLRALLAGLGLSFAAIDLRRRDDGEHVFLEVNPAGQWRDLEARTGQPITDAVAALLAGGTSEQAVEGLPGGSG